MPDRVWRPLPPDDYLGIRLLLYTAEQATWYDWIGVFGLIAFITRVAFRTEPGPWNDTLDWLAISGVVMVLCVVGAWATWR